MFIIKWLQEKVKFPFGWLQKPKPRSRFTKADREALYYDDGGPDRVSFPREWRWVGLTEALKRAIKDYRRERREFIIQKRAERVGLHKAKAKLRKVKAELHKTEKIKALSEKTGEKSATLTLLWREIRKSLDRRIGGRS